MVGTMCAEISDGKYKGLAFLDNAFVVELKNYGMVLGIQ